MNEATKTLADLLATHNRSEIARRLHRSRAAVGRWATGDATPSPMDLPALAEILHIDLGELTMIVAADARRISDFRKAVA